MFKPVVDIVLPSWNREKLLQRAVHSVHKQTYKNWNLIIVDDGSTDGSSEQSYGSPTKVLSLKNNRGVSYARNQGIKQGHAKWIAFLDSDDEWFPQKLEKQIEYLHQNPQYEFVHCNEIWKKNGKLLPQKKKHKKRGGRVFIPSVKICCISPSAALLKRSLLEGIGLFREDFPVCEDYELWLRITSRYDIGFLDKPLLIKHGGHPDQLSKKYFGMDYWRIKALLPFLKHKTLSMKEKEAVKQTLIHKLSIFLKGCKKHKNHKQEKEMKKILQQISSLNSSKD